MPRRPGRGISFFGLQHVYATAGLVTALVMVFRASPCRAASYVPFSFP